MKTSPKEWCLDAQRLLRKAFLGALLASTVLLHGADSIARDMQGRLGLGYNAEFANTYTNGYRLPGVSIKYGLTRDIGLEGIVGIATTSPSNSVTAIKFFKNLFYETNLNFYAMAGAGILNFNGQGGVQILAGFGVEFFVPGLESLGLAVETGASFDNGSGSYALKTLGVSFLDAGIHFYF